MLMLARYTFTDPNRPSQHLFSLFVVLQVARNLDQHAAISMPQWPNKSQTSLHSGLLMTPIRS
jgi:hypothetical protein